MYLNSIFNSTNKLKIIFFFLDKVGKKNLQNSEPFYLLKTKKVRYFSFEHDINYDTEIYLVSYKIIFLWEN